MTIQLAIELTVVYKQMSNKSA